MPPRSATRKTARKSAPMPSIPHDPVEFGTAADPDPPASGDDAIAELPSQTEVADGDAAQEDANEEEEQEPFEEEDPEMLEEVEEDQEVEEMEVEEEEDQEGEEVEEDIEEEEQDFEEQGGAEEEVAEEKREVPEPVKEKRKQREFEVFVGGLPRDATEEDIKKVFKKVGEVVEVRLAKNSFTKMNKGFAFVRFETIDQAKRATVELKRTHVKGKLCGVIKSNDNETLHLGNICTTWTKDDLMEKLKAFELENLEEVHLIEDPSEKGKNRGYAFLDFSTHMDAVSACSKLQKRDIFFGTDVRADVSFSKTVEPDEEVMAQVKSVFLDGLPATWDEDRVVEHFKIFGEIENVQLARNMPSAKRKDFGFVCFMTRQAALDCIENVNRDGVGNGANKVSVKATLKKPLQRRGPPILGVRGGYIGKSFGARRPGPYASAHSYPGRPSRSRELMGRGISDRPRGGGRFSTGGGGRFSTSGAGRFSTRDAGRFSTRGAGGRAAISPPTEKFGSQPRREFVRDRPGFVSSRTRDPYLQSSSRGRRSVGNYQDLPSAYSHHRGGYAVDSYDSQFQSHEDYEYPVASGYKPGYKRPYSEIDNDMLRSSSLARQGRRPDLEMDVYPRIDDSYNHYSRYLPDEHLGYDRMGSGNREYGSRYLPGSAASRSYY